MNQNNSQSDSATGITVSPATAGSFILAVSFFLPWINFVGGGVAGYELHNIWAPGQYVWPIPVTALAATILGLCGRKNVALGQLAGGLPLVFLAVALYQFGGDLFRGLAIGGWLTLVSGVFLLCIVPRMAPSAPKKISAAGKSSDSP